MTTVSIFLKRSIEHFKNLKLRNKIALATTLLISVSTASTLFFLYIQSKDIVLQKSYNETHEITVQLVKYYDEKLTKIINLTQGIFQDQAFKLSLNNILWNPNHSYAIESTTMQSLFQQTRLKDTFVDSIFLYTTNGVFHENNNKVRTGFDFTKSNLYKGYQINHIISWQSGCHDVVFDNNSDVIPVVLGTTIDGVYDKAVLVLNLKENAFKASLEDISSNNKGSIFLLNTDGSVVTSVDAKDYAPLLKDKNFLYKLNNSSGYFKYNYNNQKLYVNYAVVAINGWKTIMVQPESELLKDVNSLQITILLIGLFTISFAGMMSIRVASTITKPIYRLRNTILKVQSGELDSRFKNNYSDEIGQLGESFNGMLDEIQSLIKDLGLEREKTKEEQKQKSKAEIRALQAQINPHFLYNTLDSIYWKSKLGENQEVSEMIISLSKLLRIGLSKGRDKIQVESEIEHVRNYLYLESNMYKGKFDYVINIQGDISRYYIVKTILQPFVENSLLHGFNDIDYRGNIIIDVKVRENNIILVVKDNGRGMNIEVIRKSLQDNVTESEGYALKNVYQRLKLNYGEECSINLRSEPFKETSVEIIIPAEEI
ncbi:MAG: sensor histidine kinase [Clostridium sp.]|uniref:sensor histidine kinase n=1 Tax=Clostridium sp. TaxID=1506 RepID=UPI003D6D0CC8